MQGKQIGENKPEKHGLFRTLELGQNSANTRDQQEISDNKREYQIKLDNIGGHQGIPKNIKKYHRESEDIIGHQEI